MSDDVKYMKRALELAALGIGRTSPNPMVGCVIVRGSEIIGEGHHARAGEAHAEVNAINAAGGVEGATIYVTLEPCCHHGKTPPCTDLIIEHKPSRVVVAMRDPNPLVSGKGICQLESAGIKVDVEVLEDEARRLNEAFVKFITTKTPFVIAKCAMTLDGKIATHAGDSWWVSGETSRRMVHELRDRVDAIMVGSRTVMLDDPSLTTRLDEGRGKDPVRIILDAGDYLAGDRKVFQLQSDAPTWVAVPEGGVFEGADELLEIPGKNGGLDMRMLMSTLAERDITSVLIEGGGTTLATAFEAGVVDKVQFFVAPKIVGGRDAVTAVEGGGIDKMTDAIMLENMSSRAVGEDILIEAYVKKGS